MDLPSSEVHLDRHVANERRQQTSTGGDCEHSEHAPHFGQLHVFENEHAPVYRRGVLLTVSQRVNAMPWRLASFSLKPLRLLYAAPVLVRLRFV